MNQRPSGYEPDELPDCSTPHRHHIGIIQNGQTAENCVHWTEPPIETLSASALLQRNRADCMSKCRAANRVRRLLPDCRPELSRWRGGRVACYTPRVIPQPDVLIHVFHFRFVLATILNSVDVNVQPAKKRTEWQSGRRLVGSAGWGCSPTKNQKALRPVPAALVGTDVSFGTSFGPPS